MSFSSCYKLNIRYVELSKIVFGLEQKRNQVFCSEFLNCNRKSVLFRLKAPLKLMWI